MSEKLPTASETGTSSNTDVPPQAKSDAFAAIHSAAKGLHTAGALNGAEMLEYDAMCLKQQRTATPADEGPSEVDRVMTLVQEFASAWSTVGGRFDNGNGLANAEEAKQRVRDALTALSNARAVTVASEENTEGDTRSAIPADVLRDIDAVTADAMATYPGSLGTPDYAVNVAYWLCYGKSGYARNAATGPAHADSE
ncbi:hypothetical protein F6X40_17525 [Paraburkholderia sp. UCT31]|uniref:hypothetical protein n=1 Tax=Paraburkholderia sp. UCT31 TaxID=2615209 RepID=UPI0016561284|nr:hypothetical protein [Paraburkholderia sp. UCT31]MBC8738561.1 hypothetical protein [Paraburkholderia sp. UCT31]